MATKTTKTRRKKQAPRRTNLLLTDDNREFLAVVSKSAGLGKSELLNLIIADFASRNQQLMKSARKFNTALNAAIESLQPSTSSTPSQPNSVVDDGDSDQERSE